MCSSQLGGFMNNPCIVHVPAAATPENKGGKTTVYLLFQGTGEAFLGYLTEEGIRCRSLGKSGFRRLFDIP